MEENRQAIAIYFVLFLILNSTAAYAYSEAPNYPEAKTAPYASGEDQQKTYLFEDTFPSLLIPGSATDPTTGVPIATDMGASAMLSCATNKLSGIEAQRFLNLLRDGFLGNQLSAGLPDANKFEREKFKDQELALDKGGKKVNIEVPEDTILPEELTHLLHDTINGPYALGVVLNDTIRVGRCKDYDPLKQNKLPGNIMLNPDKVTYENPDDINSACPLVGKNLMLRNSGEGIIADFQPMWDVVKDIGLGAKDLAKENVYEPAKEKYYGVKDLITGGNEAEAYKADLNKEEQQKESISDLTDEDFTLIRQNFGLDTKTEGPSLESKLALSDENADKVMEFKRKLGKRIPNFVFTNTFNAGFTTNCSVSTSQCTISVYSLFDKFYNQWYSGEMVVSNFGPVLLSRAKKLFNLINLNGGETAITWSWPWLRPFRKVYEHVVAKLYDPINGGKLAKYLAGRRAGRIYANRQKYPLIGEILNPLMEPGEWTSKYLMTKGTEFRQWFAKDFLGEKGFLERVMQMPRAVRKTFLQTIEDVRNFSRTQGSIYQIAKRKYYKSLNKYGYGSPQEIEARIIAGREGMDAARGYDEIRLDIGEWAIQKDEGSGLYSYFVKTPDGRFIPIYRDPAQLNRIEGKFRRDLHFGGEWPADETAFMMEKYETSGRNLNLYEIKPGKFVDTVTVSDIHKNPAIYAEKAVETDMGKFMKADERTLGFLKHNAGPKVKMFELGGFEKAKELKPEDFAQLYLTSRMEMSAFSEPWRNMNQMYQSLLQRGVAGRKYTSVLDKAFSDRQELIKDYVNPKGGIKWTAGMYLYWGGKQGFGSEDFAGYMLADKWFTVKWNLGEEAVYNYAFIDFFAQEGSDEGDLFKQILSKLPYDMILNYVAEQYKPVNDIFKKLTGKQIRYKVENLAYYANTPKECKGMQCTISLDRNSMFNQMQGMDYATFYIASKQMIEAHMLEYATTPEAKKSGTTLIAFSRGLNVKGEGPDTMPEEGINLAKGIKQKNTCRDVVLKFTAGIFPKKWNPSLIGGAMAFGESAIYMVFGFSGGVFASILQQTLMAPQMQNCIDVDGGYYAQIFAPAKEEVDKTKKDKSPSVLSTEKMSDIIKTWTDRASSWFSGVSPELSTAVEGAKVAQQATSYTASASGKLKEEVESYLKSTHKQDLIQADVSVAGGSTGKLQAQLIFSFWFSGETSPQIYKTQGKKVIGSADGNVQVVYDYNTGKMYKLYKDKDGKQVMEDIITDPNIVRSDYLNTDSLSNSVPDRYTLASLPMTDTPLFEMNTESDLYVLDAQILECIKQGVMQQTGVPLTSNNLREVFGPVTNISTDFYNNVTVWNDTKRIVATGLSPVFVQGMDSKLIILGNRKSYLYGGGNKIPIGNMEGIQFQHGFIVYKHDTGQLLIVLKRNAKAILGQNDVAGLKAKLTTDINPENGCPEPAIDLEAIAVAGSDLKQMKVDNFNKSIDMMGPFKVFETPTRRYIFYAKLENGECKDYFKVIDKDTGEVLIDAPIKKGSMKQTPTGIEFETEDGKKHTLDFSADNGVPKIKYNGQPGETLIGAQGKNGSFWYDPETGNWYPENGHMLPLDKSFRDGVMTKVDGSTNTTTSTGGLANVYLGDLGKATPFNLPSLPEELLLLIVYMFSMIAAITIIRIKIQKDD
ncbi:MAG: hypothetical protein COT15_00365 [Candidatus Diapherotrites archaeon CG08_land_8_20_14_0_20_34_12]|nr:MAG: hypothetical protein COT15_00365 [Candidatus Diapherotrites archaeon CG08_land_8_20_14_0_20_34_12]